MKLSITTVSFNTRELLERRLRSAQLYPPAVSFEEIVVDNGSTDKSAEMVAERFPNVRLIRNDENRGFAAANNQGLQIAAGEIVLFLNSDTELLPGSLDPLIMYLESSPTVGVVGPTEQTGDGMPYPTICPFPDLSFVFLTHTGLRHRFYKNRAINPYRRLWEKARLTGEPTVVDWLSGASFMVRRKVLEEIGFFDERYFFYMEETDLCKRACAAGWLVVFVPYAAIIHHGNGSTGKAPGGLLTLSGTLSELRYFSKHHTRPECLILKCLLCCEMLLKFVIAGQADPRQWAYWEILRAIFGRRPTHVIREDLCRQSVS